MCYEFDEMVRKARAAEEVRRKKLWLTTAKTSSPRPRSPPPPERRPGNPFRPEVAQGFSRG